MNEPAADASSHPAAQPWWRPAPGQGGVLSYLVLVHALAVVGLALHPVPGWSVFLVALGLAGLGGLGTTVAYHRALAHSGLRLHSLVEQPLIFFAVLNGSSAPRQWAAKHRLHHARADTRGDVSSPRYGGFMWSHLRWLYQVSDVDEGRWTPDLAGRRYDLWTRLQPALIVLSLSGGLVLGGAGFFWIGAVRLLYSLHLQCCINSLAHLGERDQGGGDASVNLWWLGPFQFTAWGENWHRNHHADSSSARFGRGLAQIDVGWYVIWLLEKLGLAWDVRRGRPLST